MHSPNLTNIFNKIYLRSYGPAYSTVDFGVDILFFQKIIFFSHLNQSLEMKNTHICYLRIALAFYEAYFKRSISKRIFKHGKTCHDYQFVVGKKLSTYKTFNPRIF